MNSAEHDRLAHATAGTADWRRWGTYLSERAWGTVREDYSADGDAWAYFPFEHAPSRAYRWSEDGLADWCDRDQIICMGLALWNGRDPVLKERPDGLDDPGKSVSLATIAGRIARRLSGLVVRDEHGRRATHGDNDYFHTDPHWRDLVHFDGDTGRGLGAGHQTGWTATIALLLQFRGRLRFD